MIMILLNSELITRRRRRKREMWVRQVVLEIKAEAETLGIYMKEN